MINRKKKASASGSGGSATTIQRAPTPPRSIVELCGKHAGRCGYCKTSSNNSSSGDAQGKGKGDGNGKGGSSKKAHTSATFGLSAKCLLCEDYQALIDLGWRRSGTYLYRPINAETCCPCYTIRLQADQFQPSRSQRQLRGRMERLMASSSSIPSSASSVSSSVAEALDTSGSSKGQGQQPMKRRHRAAMSSSSSSSASQQQEADTVLPRLEAALREAVRAILKEEEGVEEEKDEATAWTPLLATVRVQRVVAHAHSSTHLGDYSSPTALALTAQLRKRAQGQQAAAAAATPALAQRLLIHLLPLASSLGLRSIKAAPNGFLNFFLLEEQKGGGRVVAADAMGAVHALRTPTSSSSSTTTEEGSTMDVDEATGGVGGGRKGEPAVAMEEEEEEEGGGGGTTAGPFDFVVETVPPKVTEEVFALYRKYQVAVHGDKPEEVTKEGFNRFLVQSPLVSSSSSSSSSSSPYLVPYGSYHQLYRLNGKLVAVGVVDILPKCLSSVYCFYDPDYRHLSLGKVTALWEIQWVQAAAKLRPSLQYYYLGFYIHSCPKMRYKGGYEPSELLCPVTGRWTTLDERVRGLLDEQAYAQLALPVEEEEMAGKKGKERGGGRKKEEEEEEEEEESDMNDDDDEEEEDEEEEEEYGLHHPLSPEEVKGLQSVVMDVGPLSSLPARSQQMLIPILRQFLAHVTPALAPRLMIKLRQ